ncbi:TIGR03086 family metal-binding protein [Streptomyces sp. NPDC052225]|uniref:TIGR03086 family metal-binding protein n=1 Tax=Streptomyces sp. NPDC052225 TaxID=3154949 RepID=UPI00341983ED
MNPDELLERALAYALGSLAGVTACQLSRPTPCARWDLGALIGHLDDSLDALREGLGGGCVGPGGGVAACPGGDPGEGFRARARALLGTPVRDGAAVVVADRDLPAGIVAAVGAVEIAVHGWDVAQARGLARPVPSALAAELLPLARRFVACDDRGPRFAQPVEPGPRARPGDRLVAFLGRRPGPPRFLFGPGPVCLP